jgi:hypothetical protein
MGRRDELLGAAIIKAIQTEPDKRKGSVLSRILAFFNIFATTLARYRADLFQKLRSDWQIDEKSYRESFSDGGSKVGVKALGDLGYSGSVGILSRFITLSLTML